MLAVPTGLWGRLHLGIGKRQAVQGVQHALIEVRLVQDAGGGELFHLSLEAGVQDARPCRQKLAVPRQWTFNHEGQMLTKCSAQGDDPMSTEERIAPCLLDRLASLPWHGNLLDLALHSSQHSMQQ